MDITTVLADKENAFIIKNMYPLYLYDLSEIYGNVPNEYGIYEEVCGDTFDGYKMIFRFNNDN